VTFFLGGFPTNVVGGNPSARIDDFFDGAANGALPPFSLIDPDFQASDDHPAHNIQRGQAFVASVYKALAESPLWPKTLLIITYDENGGFFDHVPPPKTEDDEEEFTQLGFRVPAFVIGPTVKKGYVCKTPLDHSSIAATLKTRWGIQSLSKRMNAAKDVTDCIDPAKIGAPAPPPPGMPQVAMTLDDALHDGVGQSSQPELDDLVDRGLAPAVDNRDEESRIRSWLERAIRLGAVRIIGN
jgi:phospholipase C